MYQHTAPPRGGWRLGLALGFGFGFALLSIGTANAQIGAPTCLGTSCPCANDDPDAGCGNAGDDGDEGTGALLEGFGSADLLLDDLTLRASGIRPGAHGLIYMGARSTPRPFGDGQRCVGGAGGGTFRFPVRRSGDDGTFLETGIIARSQGFGGGAIGAGSTWNFQAWYRDPQGPCASGFNLTSAIPVTFDLPGADAPIELQLAGHPLGEYPFFEFTRASNEGSELYVSVDTTLHPGLVGTTPDLFMTLARTPQEWANDPSLIDIRGASQPVSIDGDGVEANTFLVDAGTLAGTQGTEVGIGYDVVLDVDRDGNLGPGDLIDGLSTEAGIYVVRDVNIAGPHAVTQVLYSGGVFLEQTAYFPTDIASLGELPLVVVSHGNGHNYLWYDHIGFHLASYGYVVMSHRNNTMPGSGAAATTTITNTDYFLGNLALIEDGVLDGHVDGSKITWIGHSRGGEGVVRAYDQIFEGTTTPAQFGADDIVLVSSIAPTDFAGPGDSTPHGVNYHLWTGSADNDVNGGPNSEVVQTYHLLDRATGTRLSTTIQGAGHATFHDGGGSWVADGPCRNGPFRVHRIMRGYLVPLLAHFVREEIPAKDFLWRQWEGFRPVTGSTNECVLVQLEYVDGPDAGNLVIDDFQSEPEAIVSSSGGSVTFDVEELFEGQLNDANNNFTDDPTDPMNGMTRARPVDTSQGVVFGWSAPSFLEFSVPEGSRDLRDFAFVSLKACQATRHPNTEAELGDLTFDVTLRDVLGRTSSISIGASGGGVEEPYQRTGAGAGVGWHNEFETLRIRLTDFRAEGSGLDLGHIAAIRLEFGGPGHAPVGRLGLDDVEFTRD